MEREFASLHASCPNAIIRMASTAEQSICCINIFPVSPYSEEICRTVQSVFCSLLQSNGIAWQAEAQQLSCCSTFIARPHHLQHRPGSANSTSNFWTCFSPGLICRRSGGAGGSSTIGTSNFSNIQLFRDLSIYRSRDLSKTYRWIGLV